MDDDKAWLEMGDGHVARNGGVPLAGNVEKGCSSKRTKVC